MTASGFEYLSPAFFLADTAAVGSAAWVFTVRSGHARRGVIDCILAWILTATALVAGTGMMAGLAGAFHLPILFGAHLLILAGLRWRGGAIWDAAFPLLRERVRVLRSALAARDRALWAALILGLILANLTLLAALSKPTVFDSLTYHLPRVGVWLQEGRIGMLDTADERMNFVAFIPELITAWMLLGTRDGFDLAVLPQAIGGVTAVVGTIGLARETGLGRLASVFAGTLLLGMGNVVVQFTAAQTDLFTTGIFVAAFFLWLRALRRGEGTFLAGAGAALALGAKGTLFYLGPSALAWVLWLAWRHPSSPRAWGRTLLGGAVGVLLFAAPGFIRNWHAYGDVLGPRAWVERVHGAESAGQSAIAKIGRNLVASLAQNFEPNSQPWPLRDAGRAVGRRLAALVPERDGLTLDGVSRQAALQVVLERTKPDADATAFGFVALLLFGGAVALACFQKRQSGSRLVLLWAGGVVLFLLFYHAMQQWHPFGFRYFVLLAPWIAVVAAWGLERAPGAFRVGAWIIVLWASGEIAWRVTTETPQAGWRSLVAPERNVGWFVSESWREWAHRLQPTDLPLRVAVEGERPVTGFFRQPDPRAVSLSSPVGSDVGNAEDLVRHAPGWVIVPASRFLGREGRVAGDVWLFFGEENSPFSVAAYRALRADELPPPLLYRHRIVPRDRTQEHNLLVRTWAGNPARISLVNQSETPVVVRVSTSLRQTDVRLSPGKSRIISPELSPDAVAEVTLVAAAELEHGSGPVAVSVELVR